MEWHYDDSDFPDALWADLEGSAFGVAIRISPFWSGQPKVKHAEHWPSGYRWRVVSATEWGLAGFSGDAWGEVVAARDEEGWATADCLAEAMDVGEHMARAVEAWLADRTRRPGKHIVRERVEQPLPPPPTGPVAVLVACSGVKLSIAAPARKLYRGSLFEMRVRWADTVHGGIAGILSAAHGLVLPDEELEPYDLTLTQQTKEERALWAARVSEQLQQRFPAGTRIVVLAGAAYLEGWVGPLTQTGRAVEWRRFRGVGYEREALSREIAEREALISGQLGLLGVA